MPDSGLLNGPQPAAPGALFFGREREFRELSAALEEAIAGRGRLFLLTGPAGIGKTRLADRFSEEARTRGALVLWGRSWEGDGAPPFWSWVQVLRAYLRGRDRTALEGRFPAEMAAVSKMIPQAGRAPSSPVFTGADSERERFEQFQAIASFFAEAAAIEPLVLLFDDLHAADLPSLLLLRFLSRELRGMRALVIATARDRAAGLSEEARAVTADLAREATHLPISGLREAEITRFFPNAERQTPAPNLVRKVHQVTDGNPLFVQEIVRSLALQGRGDAVRVPPALNDALRQRFGPLPPSTHDVLSIAAVAGREFSVSLLQEISERPFEQVVTILDAARADGIVVESAPPGVYRFAHGLFREMLYDDLPTTRRLGLHRALGERLLREVRAGTGPILAEIAHHLVQAAPIGTAAEAIEYSSRAGQAANAQLAYEEAVLQFERAVQLCDSYPPADERRVAELLLALAEAMRRAGDAERTRETFRRAAEVARRCAATDLQARAALGLAGRWNEGVGANPEIVAMLGEVLERLGREDTPLRATVVTRLVYELLMANQAERCHALAAEALAVAQRVADPRALAYARDAWLWAFHLHEHADVVASGSEILEMALAAGDAELALRGHEWRIVGFLERGLRSNLDAEIEAMHRLVERLRQPYHRWPLAVVRSMMAMLEGRFDDAERLTSEALELGQRFEPTNAVLFFGTQLFFLRREQGRLQEIAPMLDDFAKQHGMALPAFRIGFAYIHAALGRADEARAILEDLWREGIEHVLQGVDALTAAVSLGDTVVLLGDSRRAADLRRLVEPLAERSVVAGTAFVYFGSVARVLGSLAALTGDVANAAKHFEHALEVHRRIGARPLVARTAIDYGTMLRRRGTAGDAAKAAALIAEGTAIARELGMPLVPAMDEPVPTTAPAPTPVNSFRHEGEYWTIAYGDATTHLKDARGLHYLVHLLRHPGEEFHVKDLVDLVAERDEAAMESAAVLGDAGEVLDSRARAEYRRRLEELKTDLDEAVRWADLERAARLRQELEFITNELRSAYGLGGRAVKSADVTQRARKAVTNRIRDAIARVERANPRLGEHLSAAVRMGIFCSYQPTDPVSWSF